MIKPKTFVPYIVSICFVANSSLVFALPEAASSRSKLPFAEKIVADQPLRVILNEKLEDESFIAEMTKMGIDKNEVKMRLAAMSNQELGQIKNGVERQAGGDAVVISVSTLLLILLVILLLR